MQRKQRAIAYVSGGTEYPGIRGTVKYTEVNGGTMVDVDLRGLPQYDHSDGNLIGPHGFHLHNGTGCEPGTTEDPFPNSGTHYNPTNQPHPGHAGDFPVLFSNDGVAKARFFTDRLSVDEIVGKPVVLHKQPDDFRSQPAGDSGAKIACGMAEAVRPSTVIPQD